MSLYTILGGSGFIGSEVTRQLQKNGYNVFIPERNDKDILKRELGIIIYCVGSGDCENLPFSVFDANVKLLSDIIINGKFKKIIYLSSTRLYMNNITSVEESDFIIGHQDNRRLFNLTKLVAEELCLKSSYNILIVRPSNVYGAAFSSPLFLPSITRDAINKGIVNMYVSPNYSKDYVSVSDVANAIVKLSLLEKTKYKIYNLAYGKNVSANEIASVLIKKTKCEVNWIYNHFDEKFPVTSIDRIKSEISYKPRFILKDLEKMVDDFRAFLKK
ncbi:MAG TPA: NAD-dependent epimerase/dehydratase family protein [Arsenophonus apicola]|uniref:NAD-dependent epimerase/dehydratase family protein n=1 Tax=Arsenophonus TaxID=637 RepID=UPI0015D8AFDF|nr:MULTISPECIES: NAD(P)-dependent oxidoreductase [Arsenophonus]UBX29211.1 NAD(P)-dependent oxidoreductase [Arsenophonus apicola]